MKAIRLDPFGWELSGVDLRTDVTDDLVADIVRLLHADGAVLFRGQQLDDAQQIDFARHFGKFSGHNPEDREGLLNPAMDGPRLQRLTNQEGVGRANELVFHADNFHTAFPFRYLMLYGLEVTTEGRALVGGETLLASGADALARLPASLREELGGLQCRITAQTRGSFVRPCIERHWATGQPYLVPSQLTEDIIGAEPSRAAELCAAVSRMIYDPAFVYRHAWRNGDLLVWDNRLLQHARAYYDNAQNRVLRRSAMADDLEPTAIAL